HAWIPNTYWVKSQRFRDGGTAYFIRYAAMTGVFSFPLALIGLITNRAARIPRAMTAAGCVYLAYVFYIGGDWMAYGRFLIPAIPLIAPAAAATVFSIRRPMAQAVFGLMFGFAFLVSGVSTEYDLLRQRPTRYRDILTWESEHMTDWKAVALWLKENMPKHYVLCTGLAGIIPYYSELTVIDRGGLNDREIAQIVYTSIGMDEENRRIEAVLVDRRPDIMLPEERSFQMVSDRPPIQQRQSMQLESLQRMYTHRIESLNGRFFAFYQLKP
ncbi:hypothetical protein JXA80_00745, partial [bacterium]|nr:hypothetical protein [candidate division CSSED10-310 bacterium]